MSTTTLNSSTSAPERYRFLDVLRGVAILGILPVNMAFFAYPVFDETALVSRSTADQVAILGVGFLFEFKFITIFSFLFGVGIAILAQRQRSRGDSPTPVLVRRLLALLAFGVAHVVFLWYGDILIFYAVTGLALFWAERFPPMTLARIGGGLIGLSFLPILAILTILMVVPDSDDTPSSVEEDTRLERAATGPTDEFREALWEFHPGFEAAVYREGTYGRQIALRLLSWVAFAAVFVIMMSARTAGLFLLGMACARAGWILRPAEHRTAFQRLTRWGLGVGIPIQAVATTAAALGFGTSEAQEILVQSISLVASLGMAAGYIGILGLLCAHDETAAWTRPLAAVGRMAFSNYILQTAICTFVFYSWGLGYFGSLSWIEALGIVVAIWALQLAWSPLWLHALPMGPLERVWRWLTYGSRPLASPSLDGKPTP